MDDWQIDIILGVSQKCILALAGLNLYIKDGLSNTVTFIEISEGIKK
ncbi:hypothetical protein [Clostridium psychrophilum]|nr:hypothetical protein [Clostridium psychrophilum]MBU3183154.1 hypothetical protein [Clostridium psychrophilum]